ncbi:MAG: zinc-binding dehydrogenase [Bacillota bacterium]
MTIRCLILSLSPARVAAVKIFSKIWPGIYFCSRAAPLRLAEVHCGSLLPGWVKVKNRIAGICGSDLHMVFIDADPAVHPALLSGGGTIFLGHEVVGRVVETGSDCRFKPGDRVVMRARQGKVSCLFSRKALCSRCLALDYNHCEREDMDAIVGGGLGEGFVAPEGALFAVPESLPDDQAVLIEPAAVSVRGVLRCPPEKGEKVFVYGAGTIGFLVLQAIRTVQPECKVVLLAQYAYQKKMALDLGANEVWMAQEDFFSQAAGETGARLVSFSPKRRTLVGGFDKVYDCVGTKRTLQDSLRLVRSGGFVVLVGAELKKMDIDLTPVWYNEVTLVGSGSHGYSLWKGEKVEDYRLAAHWLEEGRLSGKGFITHRYGLEDYKKAFLAAVRKKESNSVKVVFEMPQN